MKKIFSLILLIALVWGFIWVNNNWVQTTEFTITSPDLPEAFKGKKIVQISDLHNATFGDGQSTIIEKVEDAKPDVIFITGDLVDSNRYDLEAALVLVDALIEISDVFFVTGNHEIALNEVDEINAALEERGVTVLMNETVQWEIEGETVQIVGINDPLMGTYTHEDEYVFHSIEEASATEEFAILLAHRPEFLWIYAEEGMDIVFSGHAHGGQVRIPGLGGLIAPGQGWLPAMTGGIYEENDTQLILSKGLGNSNFPVRIFNLPEVVVVTLE
ncbi:MAG TPA: metallophosphoesterase [Planococcus sp. (in: firmicutes)]|nr:metallophosphoesterase [Planococcus sp. (in: firmicutes)]